MGQFCRRLKKAVQDYKVTQQKKGASVNLRDANGSVVNGKENKLECWKNHFCELLNRPSPANPLSRNDLVQKPVANLNVEPPTVEEMERILRSIKSGKAGGEDGLPPEVFKHGGAYLAHDLVELMSSIWHSEKIPEKWLLAELIPLFKKGDASLCKNYRQGSYIGQF